MKESGERRCSVRIVRPLLLVRIERHRWQRKWRSAERRRWHAAYAYVPKTQNRIRRTGTRDFLCSFEAKTKKENDRKRVAADNNNACDATERGERAQPIRDFFPRSILPTLRTTVRSAVSALRTRNSAEASNLTTMFACCTSKKAENLCDCIYSGR